MEKEPLTILERLSQAGFSLSRLYDAKNNAYLAPLVELILASEHVLEQSKLPWSFKSLAQIGREEFVLSGRVYEFDKWDREAQRVYAENVGRYIYYEDGEGLLFFVHDENGGFRVARPGDPAYDFVRRLNKEDAVSDLRFTKAPSWAEELFLGRENFEAYKLIWYDVSGEDYEVKKRLKSEAVIRETQRRMSCIPGLTNAARSNQDGLVEQGLGGERSLTVEPSGVTNSLTVTLPHMTKALTAVFKIMWENWADFDAKRMPKQGNIAREIDQALGWGKRGDPSSEASRDAKVIAKIIKPDAIGESE